MFDRILSVAVVAVALVAATLCAPAVASADQRSIDLQVDIGKTFDAVEKNKSDFEAVAKPTRNRIQDLANRAAEIQSRADRIPSGTPDGEQKQRELNAEAIQTAAEYLKEASSLVSQASRLISGNMIALEGLTRRIADARLGAPDTQAIKKRIAAQAAVGRRIVGEIRALSKRAETNPELQRRMKSLRNSAAVIDRLITAQKKRLEADRRDGVGEGAGRVAGMLQAAINDLADMYAALEAEKAVLGELRDEVEIAIQIGTVDSTRQIIGVVLPSLSSPELGGVVPGIDGVIGVVRSFNSRAHNQGVKIGTSESPSDRVAPMLEIPTFNNF